MLLTFEGLFTLGTVVLDYRGYRVTAQSIIPGILEREQEQSVVYGSIDFGKTVVTHQKYLDLLQKVVNDKKEEVELCSSVECKGIIGNDGRHYILDLLRTFPPDVNFLKIEGMELSKEAQALGFPIEHKHKLSCLRQELIDAFVESRYMMFIKYAAVQLQQLGLKKQIEPIKKEENKKDDGTEKESEMEEDEAKRIVESMTDSITCGEKKEVEDSTKQIVKKAALAVGSLKETEFDIRFNPDVFSPGVVHPKENANFKKECQLVQDAADFLITVQIPAFIRDCLDHSTAPMDGATLADAIHNRGINIRYLGKITGMLQKVPQLEYVHTIAATELVMRATKHIFTSYLQGLDMLSLACAVSHFLNCLLSSCPNPSTVVPDQLNSKKRSRNRSRNKSKQSPLTPTDSVEWATLTPKSLWSQIRTECKAYFDWELTHESMEAFVE